MKASCTLAASVLAASAAALTSSASASYASQDHSFALYHPPIPRQVFSLHPEVKKTNTSNLVEKEKFAPKFDGLRFVETLVTAHR